MRMRAGLLLAASMIVADAACAQTDQVRRGPAPDWVTQSTPIPLPSMPSGPMFFRRQDVEIRLTAKGQEQYQGYRVKILDSSALPIGNISVAWNPGAGAPIVHGIKLFRDGQAIDVLKSASFEILRREDQLEAAKLDGTLTAVFKVPDLRVGDELEVELTIFSSDPGLGHNEAGILLLGASPAPGRYHLGLS